MSAMTTGAFEIPNDKRRVEGDMNTPRSNAHQTTRGFAFIWPGAKGSIESPCEARPGHAASPRHYYLFLVTDREALRVPDRDI